MADPLHPRVPASHGHDACRVQTKFAIAFLGQAHPIMIMTLRTGVLVSRVPPMLLARADEVIE
jgi:hypothetical protein